MLTVACAFEQVPDLELKPITSADDVPTVVHGTYHASWKIIQKEVNVYSFRAFIHSFFMACSFSYVAKVFLQLNVKLICCHAE